MSQRCGISVSTLSKVEHDRLTLTYDRLLQLSQRLNIRLSEFFSDAPEIGTGPEHAVNARRSIGRMNGAIRIETRHYNYYYVCHELIQKRIIPIVVKVLAKSLEEFGALVRHSGEEYVHVLSGRISVHTEWYAPVLLTT